MAEMEKKTVNAMGDVCPVPLVKAKMRLQNLREAEKWRFWWIMKSPCRTWKNGAAERIWLSGKREERKRVSCGVHRIGNRAG